MAFIFRKIKGWFGGKKGSPQQAQPADDAEIPTGVRRNLQGEIVGTAGQAAQEPKASQDTKQDTTVAQETKAAQEPQAPQAETFTDRLRRETARLAAEREAKESRSRADTYTDDIDELEKDIKELNKPQVQPSTRTLEDKADIDAWSTGLDEDDKVDAAPQKPPLVPGFETKRDADNANENQPDAAPPSAGGRRPTR